MRSNRRTLTIGLMALVTVLTVTTYLVISRTAREDVHRQTVAPAAAEAPADFQKPAQAEKLIKAAIARNLGAPPVLNVMDEKTEERPGKTASTAEPPPLPADVVATSPKQPAVPPISPLPVVPPPEIRPVSAREPSPLPPPPEPSVRITPLPVDASPKPNTEVKCPWSLCIEVVKARTILTAQAGKDAHFRVECDLLELKTPQGNIQASGNVKISSDSLDGTSERLTVNLQEDQVLLEGRAALVARRQNQNLEVKGERLSLRLVKTGPEQKISANK